MFKGCGGGGIGCCGNCGNQRWSKQSSRQQKTGDETKSDYPFLEGGSRGRGGEGRGRGREFWVGKKKKKKGWDMEVVQS